MGEIMRMMKSSEALKSGGRGRGARFQDFYKPPALPISYHISEAVGTAHRLKNGNKKRDNFILSSLETASESSSSQMSMKEGRPDEIDVPLDCPLPKEEENEGFYGVARESPYRAWLESLPSLTSSCRGSNSSETASTVEIEDDYSKAASHSGENPTPIEDGEDEGLNASNDVITTSRIETASGAGRVEDVIADEILEKIRNLNRSR